MKKKGEVGKKKERLMGLLGAARRVIGKKGKKEGKV